MEPTPEQEVLTQDDDKVVQTDNGWHEGDPTDEVSQDPNFVPESVEGDA